MRVLHWYPNFLHGGGVSNSVLGLVKAQAAAGATVAIAAVDFQGVTLYSPMSEQLGQDVELIRWKPSWTLKKGKMVLRGLPAQTRQVLTSWRPDIVHIHGEFNPDNLRVPYLFSCPLVLSPHGAFHPEVLRKSNVLLKRLYISVATPLLYRKVIFHRLSPAQGDPIFRSGVPIKVYVAPNGPSLPIDRYLAEAGEVHRNAGDPIRFLFVGRLDVYTKGLDLLLAAFAQAVQKSPHPNCRLTLVGPDWSGGRAVLEQQAKSLGIESYVGFEGTKVGKDLMAHYAESDVYIHCSRHEGQSIAITEALLFGKPAILTSTIAVVNYREVHDSRDVFVVEPRIDQIAAAIIRMTEQVDELSVAARERLPLLRGLFGWESIAAIHLKEYAAAVHERQTGTTDDQAGSSR